MEIRGFRGWRYCSRGECDMGRFLAPPYDILTESDKRALLSLSDKNIVAVDLPHCPPAEEGPEEAYAQAARTLDEWKSSGVLGRYERPAVYAYEQEYRWAGTTYARRALICGVRATPLGKDIIPHEHTFAGPKADRLKLTQHTRMQLSPILGFYRDPEGQVGNVLGSATSGSPALRGTLRDVTERLWVIDDASTIAEIAAILRGVPVYIADGHHRYATGLDYCTRLRTEGKIDGNHEANFAMFALVARDDPGLLVLPTHRIVRGLRRDFTVPRLIDRTAGLSWQRCSVEDADLGNVGAFLRRYGPGAMALMNADPAEIWIARLKDPEAMLAAAPAESDAWRALDVAVLHKLIIDRALEPWRTRDVFIEYTPDAMAVLAACRSERAQLGICLQGTPIESVEAIANEGRSMPHKSTYFYPKPATGTVLKPLE